MNELNAAAQKYAHRFRITVFIDVTYNLIFAFVALLFPEQALHMLGLKEAEPDLWPRFGAFMMILVSLFYIPGALDPLRYRATAWLSVWTHILALFFFAWVVWGLGYPTRFLVIFTPVDFIFIPEAYFLARFFDSIPSKARYKLSVA